MSTLSPDQFGFLMVPRQEHEDAVLGTWRKGAGYPGRVSTAASLHTAQIGIETERVNYFQKSGGTGADTPVEIHHMGSKAYVGEGHHRLIAAAREGVDSVEALHYYKNRGKR